jgi:hypothetical protein
MKHHVGNVPRLHGENHLSAHCAGGGVRACCLQEREPSHVVPTPNCFQLLTCAIYRCGFNPQESSLPGRKRRTGCFFTSSAKNKRWIPPQRDISTTGRRLYANQQSIKNIRKDLLPPADPHQCLPDKNIWSFSKGGSNERMMDRSRLICT